MKKNIQSIVLVFFTLALISCGKNSSQIVATVDPGETGGICNQPRASWTAPTLNVDGSALTNLAGFRVYRGLKSQDYSEVVEITNPNTKSYQFQPVTTGVTHYFAVTAYNSNNLESAYSTEVSKLVNNCVNADNQDRLTRSNIKKVDVFASIKTSDRYEVLKAAYEAASERPQFDDFKELGDLSALNCVETKQNSNGELDVLKIYRFKKVLEGGGPLLPPETIYRVIAHEEPNLILHFERTTNEFTSRDLVSVLKLDDQNSRETRIRKKGDVLHFYSKTFSFGKTVRSYGYCYEQE